MFYGGLREFQVWRIYYDPCRVPIACLGLLRFYIFIHSSLLYAKKLIWSGSNPKRCSGLFIWLFWNALLKLVALLYWNSGFALNLLFLLRFYTKFFSMIWSWSSIIYSRKSYCTSIVGSSDSGNSFYSLLNWKKLLFFDSLSF